MLNIQQVSKKYNGAEKNAINNVSIEIGEGEILALAGESGCGKTTLLRSIAGFEDIQQGEIKISNDVVSSNSKSLAAEKRGVSLVFQDLALFPHMTVEKNIAFGLNKLTKQEQSDRIKEVLELTQLTTFEKRYPHELSGGQQQRVALARAIAVKPKVLLMDEPFSNLDEILKVSVRREIKSIIKQTGITTVLVSHDAQDAFEIADRIAILKSGEVQQTGTPDHIYKEPVNAYVGRFFGEICVIEASKEDKSIMTDYGDLPLVDPSQEFSKLAFRPEAIQIETNGRFSGIVKESIFRGSHTDLIVKGPKSLDHVHIRLNNSTFQINDRISFSVSPENIMLF